MSRWWCLSPKHAAVSRADVYDDDILLPPSTLAITVIPSPTAKSSRVSTPRTPRTPHGLHTPPRTPRFTPHITTTHPFQPSPSVSPYSSTPTPTSSSPSPLLLSPMSSLSPPSQDRSMNLTRRGSGEGAVLSVAVSSPSPSMRRHLPSPIILPTNNTSTIVNSNSTTSSGTPSPSALAAGSSPYNFVSPYIASPLLSSLPSGSTVLSRSGTSPATTQRHLTASAASVDTSPVPLSRAASFPHVATAAMTTAGSGNTGSSTSPRSLSSTTNPSIPALSKGLNIVPLTRQLSREQVATLKSSPRLSGKTSPTPTPNPPPQSHSVSPTQSNTPSPLPSPSPATTSFSAVRDYTNGSRVGKYTLGKTLGQGTFGKVKYAIDTTTGTQVAIKMLDKKKIRDAHMGEQIKQEISVMKRIRHTNVIQLLEVLANDTTIFIVLELVTGGELFDKIVDEGKMDEPTARYYFQQLISGIEYCHSYGVCHRDLKPENLLLDERGILKISDFGLSAQTTTIRDKDGATIQASSNEVLHTVVGTPHYVAPEVLMDRGYDGRNADIWSAGVILYVLLAGFLPFDEISMVELFRKIVKADFAFPTWFSPEAVSLLTIILNPDPEKRATLEEIKKHPWMKGTRLEDEPKPEPPPRKSPRNTTTTALPITINAQGQATLNPPTSTPSPTLSTSTTSTPSPTPTAPITSPTSTPTLDRPSSNDSDPPAKPPLLHPQSSDDVVVHFHESQSPPQQQHALTITTSTSSTSSTASSPGLSPLGHKSVESTVAAIGIERQRGQPLTRRQRSTDQLYNISPAASGTSSPQSNRSTAVAGALATINASVNTSGNFSGNPSPATSIPSSQNPSATNSRTHSRQSSFGGGDEPDVDEDEDEDTRAGPIQLNAFDLINMVGGAAMNRMFSKKTEKKIRTFTQFTASEQPSVIIDRISQILSHMNTVGPNGPGMLHIDSAHIEVKPKISCIRSTFETNKGIIVLVVQLYQMTPELHMIECRRIKGDVLGYHHMFRHIKEQMEARTKSKAPPIQPHQDLVDPTRSPIASPSLSPTSHQTSPPFLTVSHSTSSLPQTKSPQMSPRQQSKLEADARKREEKEQRRRSMDVAKIEKQRKQQERAARHSSLNTHGKDNSPLRNLLSAFHYKRGTGVHLNLSHVQQPNAQLPVTATPNHSLPAPIPATHVNNTATVTPAAAVSSNPAAVATATSSGLGSGSYPEHGATSIASSILAAAAAAPPTTGPNSARLATQRSHSPEQTTPRT